MKRIAWVDYAKILGLITVILAHLYTIKGTGEGNVVRTYIYGFHMPFFFFISGCLFKERTKGLKEAIIRDVKSLLIPYLVFNLFFAILYGSINGNILHTIAAVPVHWLKGEGNACKASWFVICLFNIKSIVDVLYYKKWLNWAMVFVLILSVIIVYSGFRHNCLFCLSTVFGLVFYFLGMKCVKAIDSIKIPLWSVLLASIICFLLSYFLTVFNGKVSMYGADTGNSLFVFYFNSLVGSFGIIGVGMLFRKESPAIVKLSNASLGIVLLHMAFVDIVKPMLCQLENPFLFFIVSLGSSVVIYWICSIIYHTSIKVIPFVWGKF